MLHDQSRVHCREVCSRSDTAVGHAVDSEFIMLQFTWIPFTLLCISLFIAAAMNIGLDTACCIGFASYYIHQPATIHTGSDEGESTEELSAVAHLK